MRLVNDKTQPELVGIETEIDDVNEVDKIVQALNKDLIDSGFDQYQYNTVKRGNKIFIERLNGV